MLNNVLNNPWLVGIGTAVIAGLVLYYIFSVGRSKKESNRAFSDWEIKNNIVSGENASLVQINYSSKKEENKSTNNLEIQEKQRKIFEENRKRFLDPRNSSR